MNCWFTLVVYCGSQFLWALARSSLEDPIFLGSSEVCPERVLLVLDAGILELELGLTVLEFLFKLR
jgi:hypothetical protein